MGCGGSKFDPEADSVPARIRPLLRRRLEELRVRRNGGSTLKQSSVTNLSKKELLKDGVSDDDNSNYHPTNQDSDKSISSKEDSLKVAEATPLKAENVEAAKQTPPMPKSMKVAPEPEPEKLLKKTSFKIDTNNKEEDKKKGDDDNEETMEDGRLTNESLCPGSPSFRVYFIESLMNHKDDDDDDDDDDEEDYYDYEKDNDSDKKSQSEDSHADMESSDSNEELVNKKKKKRAYRLRRVIPMGRPSAGAVKHLLNVKSCYNPACGGRVHAHDKASLLTDKTDS